MEHLNIGREYMPIIAMLVVALVWFVLSRMQDARIDRLESRMGYEVDRFDKVRLGTSQRITTATCRLDAHGKRLEGCEAGLTKHEKLINEHRDEDIATDKVFNKRFEECFTSINEEGTKVQGILTRLEGMDGKLAKLSPLSIDAIKERLKNLEEFQNVTNHNLDVMNGRLGGLDNGQGIHRSELNDLRSQADGFEARIKDYAYHVEDLEALKQGKPKHAGFAPATQEGAVEAIPKEAEKSDQHRIDVEAPLPKGRKRRGDNLKAEAAKKSRLEIREETIADKKRRLAEHKEWRRKRDEQPTSHTAIGRLHCLLEDHVEDARGEGSSWISLAELLAASGLSVRKNAKRAGKILRDCGCKPGRVMVNGRRRDVWFVG